MSGPRDRYNSGKGVKPRAPVGTEGLTYAQQRAIDPAVCQRIQDGCAVHLLTMAFIRIEAGTADALDRDLAETFLRALDDGSLVSIQVHVSNYRAQQLIERVKRHGRHAVGFQRNRKPKRTAAS